MYIFLGLLQWESIHYGTSKIISIHAKHTCGDPKNAMCNIVSLKLLQPIKRPSQKQIHNPTYTRDNRVFVVIVIYGRHIAAQAIWFPGSASFSVYSMSLSVYWSSSSTSSSDMVSVFINRLEHTESSSIVLCQDKISSSPRP